MILKSTIHPNFQESKKELTYIANNFDKVGVPFGNQDRNSLKLYDFKDITINIKSFRIPNIANKISYRFFRKSKAQRSFEYANKLVDLNIGTPQPIAYFEFQSLFFFNKSFYLSEQLNCDLTFRELTTDLNYPNHENILRQFTQFTFNLHEKGVHFLDHSPGNTLITKTEKGYNFSLVDLNRMEFLEMNYETRIKNFSRLTKEPLLVKVMANEYAKLIQESDEKVFQDMMFEITDFQTKRKKARAVKNKLKFWKK